jgi:Arc/MetJ-type ribon-helix-helix transcriptional regulator
MYVSFMKMDTMNISLPASMSEYVRQNVERDYGNVSEFFRDLVREKMRRQIEADVKFLEASIKGAPPGPSEAEIGRIVALQKKLRKERNARRS